MLRPIPVPRYNLAISLVAFAIETLQPSSWSEDQTCFVLEVPRHEHHKAVLMEKRTFKALQLMIALAFATSGGYGQLPSCRAFDDNGDANSGCNIVCSVGEAAVCKDRLNDPSASCLCKKLVPLGPEGATCHAYGRIVSTVSNLHASNCAVTCPIGQAAICRQGRDTLGARGAPDWYGTEPLCSCSGVASILVIPCN
jgi:hypothetical protein